MGNLRTTHQLLLLIVFLTCRASAAPHFEFSIVDPIATIEIDSPTTARIDPVDGSLHVFIDSIDFWHFFETDHGFEYEKLDFDIDTGYLARRVFFEKDGYFYIVSPTEGGIVSILRGRTGEWNEIERKELPGFDPFVATMDAQGTIWVIGRNGLIQQFKDNGWLDEPLILDPNVYPAMLQSVAVTTSLDGTLWIAYICPERFFGCKVVTYSDGFIEQTTFDDHANAADVWLKTAPDGRIVCVFEAMRMPVRLSVCIRDVDGTWNQSVHLHESNLDVFDFQISPNGTIGFLCEPEHNRVFIEFDGSDWTTLKPWFSDRFIYDLDGTCLFFFRADYAWLEDETWLIRHVHPSLSPSYCMKTTPNGTRMIMGQPDRYGGVPMQWTEDGDGWHYRYPELETCGVDRILSMKTAWDPSGGINALFMDSAYLKYYRETDESTTCIDLFPSTMFQEPLALDVSPSGELHMLLSDSMAQTVGGSSSGRYSVHYLSGFPPFLDIITLGADISSSLCDVIDTIEGIDGVYHVVVSYSNPDGTSYFRIDNGSVERIDLSEVRGTALSIRLDSRNHPFIVAGSERIEVFRFDGETWTTDRLELSTDTRFVRVDNLATGLDHFDNALIIMNLTHYVQKYIEYNGVFGNPTDLDVPIELRNLADVYDSNVDGNFCLIGSGVYSVRSRTSLPAFNTEISDTTFTPGDLFVLSYIAQNDNSAAEYSGVCLLEVPVGDTSLFYSIPSFSPVEEGIDRIEFNLAPNEERRGELCRFTWPQTDHSRDNLGIWSALLSPDLSELKSSIYRRSFSYRPEY